MLLHPRAVAMSLAVVFFFGVSFICLASDLTPFTCCRRALVASVIVYVAVILAVRAVNAILISAMVEKQLSHNKGRSGDDER